MQPSIPARIIDPPVGEWTRTRSTFILEQFVACPNTMRSLGQSTRDDIHTELDIRRSMTFEAMDALSNPNTGV